MILHFFKDSIAGIALPEEFTYPFCYTPHALIVRAADELKAELAECEKWREELAAGKMFGVLAVRTAEGRIGYLQAFSGNLAGKNLHAGFVPPVYDMMQHDGFFKQGERELTAINHRISVLEHSEEYLALKQSIADIRTESEEALYALRQAMKSAKKERDARRKSGAMSPEEEAKLIRQSQFQKAELRRQTSAWNERIATREKELQNLTQEIDLLKEKRKRKSADLQQQIFAQFRLLNARHEERNLCSIFAEYAQKEPPAGAGECAAPKLLQAAYLNHYQPLAMGEFWWGASPRGEIRHHGAFYPSCRSKCYPILSWMLQGLKVEANPLAEQMHAPQPLKKIYEDEDLCVVVKPAGMLSVAGREGAPSVESILRKDYPEAPLIVHRLDMATSGLLLIAKTKSAHQNLQAQFAARTVRKEYIALLEGIVRQDEGRISLPLCLDPDDRPRQRVDYTHGKPAETLFRVLDRHDGRTRIAFQPVTGRTHQLRVHAAHSAGLCHPIVGDTLYGHADRRLFLHAARIEFLHPRTGEKTVFEEAPEF